MPTYDYQCRTCDHTLESRHPAGEPGPADCPQCGGPLRKKYQPPGITFNGPGFYTTDNPVSPP